mgnify:CR=1 FL=1
METFILENLIDNINICDNLIDFYKNNSNKQAGTAGDKLNLSVKKCTEIYIENYDNETIKQYLDNLQIVIDKYIKKYDYSAKTNKWGLIQPLKIQHYKQNEGYFEWHFERNSDNLINLSRHLVFMTYLNDVEHDGETEFLYQNLKIKPQKGKTIIFPSDWTHTHRGITSQIDEKYIITGWLNYLI